MIRTRFAPSPTGYIHLGNIRTAFFSWLFAKKNNGVFYIRIDDTDVMRNSQKYVNNILDILTWLDIKSDESVIFQSRNYKIYKKFLDFLLTEKKAYKCFCSKTRLAVIKDNQVKNKMKIGYDGYCKDNILNFDGPFVIRFKNVTSGVTIIPDLVKGNITMSNDEFDDFIIAKHDFSPTYNFASVVDDICYNITHIIRGDDHLSNTVKQINLMQSLNFNLPTFAHLPMILDENKKVLSKRDATLYMNYYKDNGFLPIALLNYIIRLGWSFKDKEIFSLKEMVDLFDLNNVSKSSAAINYKKLIYLNKYYIKNSSFNYLFPYFLHIEKKFRLNYLIGPCIKDLIDVLKSRVNTLKEIIVDNFYLYNDNIRIDSMNSDFSLFLKVQNYILKFYNELKCSNFEWHIINIKSFLKNFVDFNKLSISDFYAGLRIVITGCNKPHSLYEIFFLCGRILILKKIRNIIRVTGL